VINPANLASVRGGGLNGNGLFILADKTGGVLVEGETTSPPGAGQALRPLLPPDPSGGRAARRLVPSSEVRLRKAARGTQLMDHSAKSMASFLARTWTCGSWIRVS
jgi:hypothetical protein